MSLTVPSFDHASHLALWQQQQQRHVMMGIPDHPPVALSSSGLDPFSIGPGGGHQPMTTEAPAARGFPCDDEHLAPQLRRLQVNSGVIPQGCREMAAIEAHRRIWHQEQQQQLHAPVVHDVDWVVLGQHDGDEEADDLDWIPNHRLSLGTATIADAPPPRRAESNDPGPSLSSSAPSSGTSVEESHNPFDRGMMMDYSRLYGIHQPDPEPLGNEPSQQVRRQTSPSLPSPLMIPSAPTTDTALPCISPLPQSSELAMLLLQTSRESHRPSVAGIMDWERQGDGPQHQALLESPGWPEMLNMESATGGPAASPAFDAA